MQKPSKTLIRVIGGKVMLWMCYGCGMDIRARLSLEKCVLSTIDFHK